MINKFFPSELIWERLMNIIIITNVIPSVKRKICHALDFFLLFFFLLIFFIVLRLFLFYLLFDFFFSVSVYKNIIKLILLSNHFRLDDVNTSLCVHIFSWSHRHLNFIWWLWVPLFSITCWLIFFSQKC